MARTRPCKVEFEQPGRCSYGFRCSFAHTREECDVSPAELVRLRQGAQRPNSRAAPPGRAAPARDGRREGERAMRLCDNRFSHKTCRHGDDCGFAHNEAELGVFISELPGKRTAAASAAAASAAAASAAARTEQHGGIAARAAPGGGAGKAYRLCFHVADGTTCPKGDACWFAHSAAELGNAVSDLPRLRAVADKVERRILSLIVAAPGQRIVAAQFKLAFRDAFPDDDLSEHLGGMKLKDWLSEMTSVEMTGSSGSEIIIVAGAPQRPGDGAAPSAVPTPSRPPPASASNVGRVERRIFSLVVAAPGQRIRAAFLWPAYQDAYDDDLSTYMGGLKLKDYIATMGLVEMADVPGLVGGQVIVVAGSAALAAPTPRQGPQSPTTRQPPPSPPAAPTAMQPPAALGPPPARDASEEARVDAELLVERRRNAELRVAALRLRMAAKRAAEAEQQRDAAAQAEAARVDAERLDAERLVERRQNAELRVAALRLRMAAKRAAEAERAAVLA